MNKKEELLKKAEELENKINEEKERVETITIEIEKMKKIGRASCRERV